MTNTQAVIVLGSKLTSDGVREELQGKVETGISVFRSEGAKYLVMTGGFTNHEISQSEAEAMRTYAIEKGVKAESIILEERAQDTVGNGYFTRLIVDSIKDVSKVYIVTSCYHMQRAEYIFNYCFGNSYIMDFSHCFSFSPMVNNEPKLMEITVKFFEGIKSGDLHSIKRKLLSDSKYDKH